MRAVDEDDVVAAVRFARASGLKVVVRAAAAITGASPRCVMAAS